MPETRAVVRIKDKFALFHEYWKPKIVGEVNEFCVKLAKLKGEFVNHQHPNDDEMFLVLKGTLQLRLPDRSVSISEGEFFIVPKGVHHEPSAREETHVLLFERKDVVNTGEHRGKQTVEKLEWI